MSENIIEPSENVAESVEKQEGARLDKFEKGQLLTFINVRFPGNAKSFPFYIGDRKILYGQEVVAMSDRGTAVGYINSFPYQRPFNDSLLPLKTISKLAGQEDLDNDQKHDDREQGAEELCRQLVKKYKLDMDVTHVELTQFGKKAVFYFVAPQRVDFRGLVKDLVAELKMRIELRQISIRDRAAAIGGIGPCGLQLCCSCFLNKLGNVNIKMCRNQKLTMGPARLNGPCGQLKCCTGYEDDVYREKRKSLPKEGAFIKAENGDLGKVTKILIIKEQFEMLTDRGVIRRYQGNQYTVEGSVLPEDWSFPERFQHIANETANIIGWQESVDVDLLEQIKDASSENIEADIDNMEQSVRSSDREIEEDFAAVTEDAEQADGEQVEEVVKSAEVTEKVPEKRQNKAKKRNKYHKRFSKTRKK